MRLCLIQKFLAEMMIQNWCFIESEEEKAHLVMSAHEEFHADYNLCENSDFMKVILDICTFPMEENDEDIHS